MRSLLSAPQLTLRWLYDDNLCTGSGATVKNSRLLRTNSDTPPQYQSPKSTGSSGSQATRPASITWPRAPPCHLRRHHSPPGGGSLFVPPTMTLVLPLWEYMLLLLPEPWSLTSEDPLWHSAPQKQSTQCCPLRACSPCRESVPEHASTCSTPRHGHGEWVSN